MPEQGVLDKGFKNWFSANEGPAVADLWRVYEPSFKQIAGEAAAQIEPLLGAGRLARGGALAALATGGDQERDRLARACAGQWQPYEQHLRELATELAVSGLTFATWCEWLEAVKSRLLPRLVEAYAANPARLIAALQVLSRLSDRSSAVVGEQYVASKQLVVNEEHEARSRAEQALHDSEHALRASRRAVEDMREQSRQIKEANRLKSEFLANMSHELRTPLNAIIGFAELMEDGLVEPGSPQAKEFVSHILASGRHLLQLINDVLDLAKVESGKLEFHPEPLAASSLCNEVMSVLRAGAAAKRIQLVHELDPEVEDLHLDPARLKQVLYNLLSNALKFTPEAGKVTLRLQPEGENQLRVEVEDTGVGIKAEDVSRLFVEFQQLDSSASKRHAGTGLGLALTRRLVEAQGGTVGVASVPGQGSRFHAILPRRVEAAGPAGGLHSQGGVGPSILVIEDEPADRDLIAATLREAGYLVETAATVKEAVTRCRERTYAAITLDVVLPDGSGIDALREIRREARHTATPVIVVTVSSERKLLAGFAVTDVLPKPLDTGALLGTLDRAGVPPDAPGTVLVLDDDRRALDLMAASLRLLGYRSVCTSDGHAALAEARREMPRAVIVDLLMPGMDGFEFLEHFRELPDSRHVPVIVWTIKDLSARERASLRLTAQAVVPKSGSVALMDELKAFLPVRPAQGDGQGRVSG